LVFRNCSRKWQRSEQGSAGRDERNLGQVGRGSFGREVERKRYVQARARGKDTRASVCLVILLMFILYVYEKNPIGIF